MEEEGSRLLIVDDDLALCARLAKYLSGFGECAVAENAEAAIQALEKDKFRLVLTDISMPGISGLDLCELIRAQYPQTAVIIMSMNTGKAYEAASIRRGAFGFLPKPLDTSILPEMVRDALSWRWEAALMD